MMILFLMLLEKKWDTPITDKAIHESGNDDAITLWENFVSCASSGYMNGTSLDSVQLQVMQGNPIFTKPQLKALAYLEEYAAQKVKKLRFKLERKWMKTITKERSRNGRNS